jgi:hypothetical protein
MKQDHRTFLDFKAETFASRRAAVLTPKPVKRARGGRTERSPGGADVDHDQPRRSRRPTGERSRKTPGAMSGAAAKHRADRPSRRRQKFADGGAPYSASAMPYGGGPSFIPAVQVASGRFTAPAVPNQPDYTQQMINMLGHDWPDSKADGEGLISGIRLPGGGTLGDATSDALQDFRMDTLGLSAARGGMVRKRGGRIERRKGRKQ